MRTWRAMLSEKVQGDKPPRLKVAMLTPGMDCSVVALKRGNARGARGTGHPLHDPLMVANHIWDEPWGCRGRRQPSLGGTSRMTGDRLVRICEGSRGEIPAFYSASGAKGLGTEVINTVNWGTRRNCGSHVESADSSRCTSRMT